MSLTDENRKKIFDEFWGTADLQRQREFIVRHVMRTAKRERPEEKNKKKGQSLRYSLSINGEKKIVCKTIFLATIGHTCDQQVRTALKKQTQKE